RDSLVDEPDAALVQDAPILVLGIDDHKALLVVSKMSLDQRERAFADRAEADHDNWTINTGIHGPVGHRSLLQGHGKYGEWGAREATHASARSDGRNPTERALYRDTLECRAVQSQAARGTTLEPLARAITAAKSGFGATDPVALINPYAPSSAPSVSSSASRRSVSYGPGIRNRSVLAALNPNRS